MTISSPKRLYYSDPLPTSTCLKLYSIILCNAIFRTPLLYASIFVLQYSTVLYTKLRKYLTLSLKRFIIVVVETQDGGIKVRGKKQR